MRLLPLLTLLLAIPAHAAPAFLLQWGTQGTANGQFDRPHTIAVGPTGNVYVADDRIQTFTPEGVFLAQWPIMCAGFAVDAQSRIVAAHPGVNQVSIHDASGAEVARWGTTGTGPGRRERHAPDLRPAPGECGRAGGSGRDRSARRAGR